MWFSMNGFSLGGYFRGGGCTVFKKEMCHYFVFVLLN